MQYNQNNGGGGQQQYGLHQGHGGGPSYHDASARGAGSSDANMGGAPGNSSIGANGAGFGGNALPPILGSTYNQTQNMRPSSNNPRNEVELTDKLLETYKPALVFKNFVSIYLHILLNSNFE